MPRWIARDDPEVTELDRWAVSRLQRTIAEVRDQMNAFDCTAAARAIAGYTEELSNWYVRLSRRRFWDGDLAALETLRFCLGETAKMLAPFTPFIAEEIYSNLLFGRGSAWTIPWTDDREGLSPPLRLPRGQRAADRRQLEAGMEAVRRTVELGAPPAPRPRSSSASLCARPSLVAAMSSGRRSRARGGCRLRAQREGARLRAERGGVGRLSREAELPLARPSLRQEMPQVAAAIEALDAAGVAEALAAGAEVGIAIDGTGAHARRRRHHLVMEPLEGYQVEAEAGHAVALELDLDDELRREGLAREVVRAVQEARKQAGLEVSDRISLELGGDDELLDAAREHESYIAGETLATSVGYDADGAGETADDRGPRAPHRPQQGLSGAERRSPRSCST